MSKQQTKMTRERFRDTLFFQGVYRTSSKNFRVVSTEGLCRTSKVSRFLVNITVREWLPKTGYRQAP